MKFVLPLSIAIALVGGAAQAVVAPERSDTVRDFRELR